MRQLTSLDILTSALNEDENIEELYSRICKVLGGLPHLEWRLLIVDNGSTDETWSKILELSKIDSRVIGFRTSRTFLFDAAISGLLDQADADAVIIMCSDLQDPPELITEMIGLYEQGVDQVIGRVTSREGVSMAIRTMTRIFYYMASKLTSNVVQKNLSDFRLASRYCYEVARKLREANRFIRGQFAWVGFSVQTIDFERPPRKRGKSKFASFSRISAIALALQSIFAYSSVPLLFISVLGALFSFLSFLTTIILSVMWLVYGVPFAGFGTIVGLIAFGFSLVFLCLGIVSFYISAIYENVKQRPLYIFSNTTNAESSSN